MSKKKAKVPEKKFVLQTEGCNYLWDADPLSLEDSITEVGEMLWDNQDSAAILYELVPRRRYTFGGVTSEEL